MKRNSFSSFFLIIPVLYLLGFSSSLVSSQSDACGSQLAVSNLIPFSTSTMNCVNAWSSESFILRYAKNGTSTWSFILSAPDSGAYISIGFSSNGNMGGSSAVAGWMAGNGGPGVAKQYYLGGYDSGSCPPDKGNLPLVSNTTLIVSQNSRLYLAFQLNTQQPQWNNLIYAVGPSNQQPSNNYLPQHQNKASATINYAAGTVSAASGSLTSKRWHGILVGLGWGVLMPIGIMMARYFKQYDPFWFYSHISIQGIGFVLGTAGIFLGFGLDDQGPGNVDSHKAIGFVILVFGCLQVIAFLIRPDKSSKIRRYWNWYHHNVGRAAVILSIANIFFGLSLASESTSYSIFYGIFLGVWGFACLVLEVKLWMAARDS